jgi:hypothetical protein
MAEEIMTAKTRFRMTLVVTVFMRTREFFAFLFALCGVFC